MGTASMASAFQPGGAKDASAGNGVTWRGGWYVLSFGLKINELLGSRAQILFGCVVKTLLGGLAGWTQLLEGSISHVYIYILRTQFPPCLDREWGGWVPWCCLFGRVLCVSVCVTCAAGNLLNYIILSNVCSVYVCSVSIRLLGIPAQPHCWLDTELQLPLHCKIWQLLIHMSVFCTGDSIPAEPSSVILSGFGAVAYQDKVLHPVGMDCIHKHFAERHS